MKRVEDGLPAQKDLVLCDIGEEFLVPAIFYKSMRNTAGSSGFYHFSTYYHSNAEGTYQKARIENHHEIKGVRRWMPMPVPLTELEADLDNIFAEDQVIDLTPGNLVHYVPKHGSIQNGVIKDTNEFDPTVVFVVYNCAGEWEDYKNYTGVSTKISDLKSGWHPDNEVEFISKYEHDDE